MSNTPHHNKRRWFDGRDGRGWMGNAPAWFRRWRVRRVKRRMNAETRSTGEVATRQKRDAAWIWW